MTTPVPYVSRYDRRVQLVQRALTANSELGDKAALALAEHVLNALDHMPENVR
ncbi:DUF6307 family protein [Kibdelosporangium lantanae]|uniref:DUF6307 family protein n=1 Tax=Kibdelosporangium lantanae TaxID=1497396 RepID=A0ABW3MCW1_9PSEU